MKNNNDRYSDPDWMNKYTRTPQYRDKRRWRYIKARYGVTKEQWQEQFVKQEGRCAICNKHQSEFNRPLVTDHSHVTGEFRGLLCNICNVHLSVIENIDFVQKATVYLDSFKRTN
jgi:hypothetical protein